MKIYLKRNNALHLKFYEVHRNGQIEHYLEFKDLPIDVQQAILRRSHQDLTDKLEEMGATTKSERA